MDSLFPKSKIEQLLPQKKPFVMVDYLYDYQTEKITTGLTVKEDNIFIEDGYLNESGMIENIAQSLALHVSYSYELRNQVAPVGYIGSIKKVEKFGMPKLGETIVTHVEILKDFMGVTLLKGEIKMNNKALMFVEMKTILAEEKM